MVKKITQEARNYGFADFGDISKLGHQVGFDTGFDTPSALNPALRHSLSRLDGVRSQGFDGFKSF